MKDYKRHDRYGRYTHDDGAPGMFASMIMLAIIILIGCGLYLAFGRDDVRTIDFEPIQVERANVEKVA